MICDMLRSRGLYMCHLHVPTSSSTDPRATDSGGESDKSASDAVDGRSRGTFNPHETSLHQQTVQYFSRELW